MELTDAELFDQYAGLRRLSQIVQLRALMAEQKRLPAGCNPRCGVIAHGTNFGKRIAFRGNRHFPEGTIHAQCSSCRRRDHNESEINLLRRELGFRA